MLLRFDQASTVTVQTSSSPSDDRSVSSFRPRTEVSSTVTCTEKGDRGVGRLTGSRFNKGELEKQAQELAKAGLSCPGFRLPRRRRVRGPGEKEISTAPLHLDSLPGSIISARKARGLIFAIGAVWEAAPPRTPRSQSRPKSTAWSCWGQHHRVRRKNTRSQAVYQDPRRCEW